MPASIRRLCSDRKTPLMEDIECEKCKATDWASFPAAQEIQCRYCGFLFIKAMMKYLDVSEGK